MVLGDSDIQKITQFVKKEPRTVQEVSKLIRKSWVTADSYLKQISDRTGLINIKTFRKGTQGALKIVFYNHSEVLQSDDLKEELYRQIKSGRTKNDFDFMEIFQFIPEKHKKLFLEEYSQENISEEQEIISFFRQAKNQIYCFSGNLSFMNIKENGIPLLDIIEELLQRKVKIYILCRMNIASLSNINKLSALMTKYPNMIEIKHGYQPLRGFIINDKMARFKDEEQLKNYKAGELNKNTRIFYEITDPDWISCLQKVFWNLYRFSIDHKTRLKEMQRFL